MMRAAFYFVVGVLIAVILVPLSARAETYEAIQTWQYPAGTFFYSGGAWCAAYGGDKDNTLGPSAIILGCHMNSPTQACIDWKNGEYGTPTETCANSFPSCPGGGSLSGANCVGASDCPAGQTRNSVGICAVDCGSKAGDTVPNTTPTAGYRRATFGASAAANGSCPMVFNVGGCTAYTTGYQNDGPGTACYYDAFQYAGTEYEGANSPVNPPSSPGSDAPNNLCPGTVNGVEVWLPCGNTSKQTTSTSWTKDAEGNVTGTTETTTTTTTTAGGGVTTTTETVTKDAEGNVTGSSGGTKEGERDSFCKENPSATICKQTSWAGSCPAFSCDGDAVMCAIAQEQHKRDCELDAAAQPTSGLVGEAKDALAGTADPTGEAFRDPSPLSLPSGFGTTDLLPGASCPGPWNVSVLSTTFAVSVDPVCDLADLIRPLIIAFSLVLGVRIAFSGI